MSDPARAILIGRLDQLVGLVAYVYFFLIILVSVMSWIQTDPNQPFVRILRRLVDPPCRAIRRLMPFVVAGAFDLSPIVLMLLVQLLETAIHQLLMRIALM